MNKKVVQALNNIAIKLRIHSIEMTTIAGSGHPTTCLSCAEIMAALFFKVMQWDPSLPEATNADEFILSKGHAAPILYAALAEAGAISKDLLLTLRRFDSVLEGHPTPRCKWIKAATGSLGQGLSVGVGMAIAQQFSKPLRNTYVLLGDGEMAEGQIWEAMNSAAERKLNNLIAVLDMNRLGQTGPTMFGWDAKAYKKKAEAFGWDALVINGHSIPQLLDAFVKAKKSSRPSLIIAKTSKGKDSFAENKEGWHGKPFPKDKCDDEVRRLKKKIKETLWSPTFIKAKAYNSKYTDEFATPSYKKGDLVATRDAYGTALLKIGKSNKRVIAIDGDVANSTRANSFAKKYPKRFIQGYIAEQNCVGMALGLARKDYFPYFATFGAFLTRAFDQIRMAYYSDRQTLHDGSIVFCGSHAGVSIGEDGPSQMALEDISMFRALPLTTVLYPCDAVSCEKLLAVTRSTAGMTYIRTTRGKTPVIYTNDEKFWPGGLKVLVNDRNAKVALIGAGVTVHECLSAAKELKKKKIPVIVVDLYSISPIDRLGLQKIAKQVDFMCTFEDHNINGGLGDAVAAEVECKAQVLKQGIIGMPRSGTPEELRDYFGISAKDIVNKVLMTLKHKVLHKRKG
ncbi:transketolase [Candidatus Woesearchaeota archaeon]|nr:transketolase [Candidatus Woesearchaeota archaeon]